MTRLTTTLRPPRLPAASLASRCATRGAQATRTSGTWVPGAPQASRTLTTTPTAARSTARRPTHGRGRCRCWGHTQPRLACGYTAAPPPRAAGASQGSPCRTTGPYWWLSTAAGTGGSPLATGCPWCGWGQAPGQQASLVQTPSVCSLTGSGHPALVPLVGRSMWRSWVMGPWSYQTTRPAACTGWSTTVEADSDSPHHIHHIAQRGQ
mmetsp:Transcript_22619/g.57542  ORF Transcript_22619/g.57542 Transcript_22619/m.57542 type:complete len:208 (-) Transcript_22619:256-879(-)